MHSLFASSSKRGDGQKEDKDLDTIIERLRHNDPKLIGIKTLFVHSADVNKLFKALKDNKYCASVAIHGPGVTNACGREYQNCNCIYTFLAYFFRQAIAGYSKG